MTSSDNYTKMSSFKTEDLIKIFEDSGYTDLDLLGSYFVGTNGHGEFIYTASYESRLQEDEIEWANLYIRQEADGTLVGEF